MLVEPAIRVTVGAPGIVVCVSDPGLEFGSIRRIAREHLDNATGRVASKDGPLWPLLDFHVFDAIEVCHGRRDGGRVDIVDVKCDGGFIAGLPHGGTDPAQKGYRCVGLAVEGQTRYQAGERLGIRDAESFRRVSRDRGDRNWNVLVRLTSTIRRHGDLRQLSIAGGSGICDGGQMDFLGLYLCNAENARCQHETG